MTRKIVTVLTALLIFAALFFACKMDEDVEPTFIVKYHPNGGEGTMPYSTFTYGRGDYLRGCSFDPPPDCTNFV